MDPDLFQDWPTVGFTADAVINCHKPIIRRLFSESCFISRPSKMNWVMTSQLSHSAAKLLVPSYANPVPPIVVGHMLLDRDHSSKRFIRYTRKYREAKGITF
ncbi:hypothetical protein Hanom_Chr07g00644471 [Helianthus anomalus]